MLMKNKHANRIFLDNCMSHARYCYIKTLMLANNSDFKTADLTKLDSEVRKYYNKHYKHTKRCTKMFAGVASMIYNHEIIVDMRLWTWLMMFSKIMDHKLFTANKFIQYLEKNKLSLIKAGFNYKYLEEMKRELLGGINRCS